MTWTSLITTGGTRSGTPLALRPYVSCAIQLPDALGGNLAIQGVVQGVTAAGQAMPAQNLTLAAPAQPAVPGAGAVYWNLQADPFTGACTIYTSTAADPAPQPCAAPNAGQNQTILARQTLPSTATGSPYFTPFVAQTNN